MNAEVLRSLLAVSLSAMYVLAMLYLRRRRLRLGAYLFWGLFALSIPGLGPFLVIAHPRLSASLFPKAW